MPTSTPNVPILHLDGSIQIRAFRDTDAGSLASHGNNKRVWDNLRDRFPSPYTLEDAERWIHHCREPHSCSVSGSWTLQEGAKGPLLPTHYAIVIEDEVSGSIGLDFGTDVYRRSAELGYWLAEEHQRKGIMSRLVPAFLDWTWLTFGILIRISAASYDHNEGSRKVLEEAGFAFEGRRVNACIKNGNICSELMFGALRPALA